MDALRGVTIRTYEPRDRDEVWELHIEGVREGRQTVGEPDPRWDDDLRDIATTYLRDGSHFWVAERDRRLVGMVAVCLADDVTARLRRMRVTSDSRGRGLGQLLLETVEEFCHDRGYRRIIMDTTAEQLAAQRLYERNGYLKTGERTLGPFLVFDYEKEIA